MRRAAWRAAGIATLVAAALVPAPAQAADPPPIAFTETGPVEIQTSGATRVTILNNTATTLTDVKVSLELFGTAGAVPGLQAAAPGRVPPGGAAQLEITAPTLAPGSYTGFVSAVHGGTVARRPATLVVPDDTAKTVPRPLLTKRTLTVLRDDTGTDLWLALDPDVVKPETAEDQLALDPDAPLGTVSNDGGHVATVKYANELKTLDSGVAAIKVKVDGLEPIGLYSGTIRVPPGKAGTAVELKVRYTDSIVWPAIALLVGIVLAACAQRFLGLGRSIAVLREAEAELSRRFAQVREPYHGFDVAEGFRRQAKATRTAIRRLSRSRFAAVDADAKKAADDVLAALRAGLNAWMSLPAALARLDAALAGIDALTSSPPSPLPSAPGAALPPAFAAPARELRTGGKLSPAGLVARVAELETADAALAAFPAFAARTSELWALSSRLHERRAELGERADELVEARGLVASAWVQALLAESPGAFQEAKLDELLDRARARLSRLADVFGDATRFKAEDAAETSREAGTAAEGDRSRDEAAPPVHHTPGWAWTRGLWHRFRRRLSEIGLGVVALAIALLSGLDALYFGHEFGTPRDYLNALLWGFTTRVAVDAFVAIVERLRGGIPAWLRPAG